MNIAEINPFNLVSIEYYAYRTARVYGVITLKRDSVGEMEDFLANKAGKNRDNHVCYELKFRNGETLGIMFTDSKCHIGFSVIKENW